MNYFYTKKRNNWSEEELALSVAMYKQSNGKYTKSLGDAFAKQTGRPPRALDRRFGNIKSLVTGGGLKNIGPRNTPILIDLLAREGEQLFPLASRRQVALTLKAPKGYGNAPIEVITTKRIPSSKALRDWVIDQSGGICECCKQKVQFFGNDGRPRMDAHHVIFRSEGGEDAAHNLVAVCKDCHDALHHSTEAQKLKEELYDTITRLIRA